jgi:hypothetical protein
MRYVGWYSNRARGERAKKSCPPAAVALIRKVYEADPLECPKCKGPMRVNALIEDPGVIRRIFKHLALWAPLRTERSRPPSPASWPRHADLPLTYDPVPDIV